MSSLSHDLDKSVHLQNMYLEISLYSSIFFLRFFFFTYISLSLSLTLSLARSLVLSLCHQIELYILSLFSQE